MKRVINLPVLMLPWFCLTGQQAELSERGSLQAVVSVYEISGRKVYECTVNEPLVSISNLSAIINPGIYIVKISNKPAAASSKIIVKK